MVVMRKLSIQGCDAKELESVKPDPRHLGNCPGKSVDERYKHHYCGEW